MACRQCEGVEQQFDQKAARRSLRRYRRRGPDRTTRLLIEDLRAVLGELEVHDAVLLDIGGGVGAIHHDLLDGPIARAVHVDASSSYLDLAREETVRRGDETRTSFIYGDFVDLADRVPAADVVTLDRVICCYHDMRQLVSRSAAKAAALYGAVYPRTTFWMAAAVAALNVFQRVRRSAFRVFLHEPAAIDASLRAAGLERRSVRRTPGWEIVVYSRLRQPLGVS